MTHEEFVAVFNEALQLRNEGSCEAAVQLLYSLLDTAPHQSAVVGMLGLTLYYDVGDAERALPFLRKSVTMSPDSERASLGLFHALLAVDQIDEAFAEARRYLSANTSEAYEEFLKDINNTGDPGEEP
jgi:tetratricopeptide (TPR) repeat protein